MPARMAARSRESASASLPAAPRPHTKVVRSFVLREREWREWRERRRAKAASGSPGGGGVRGGGGWSGKE